jgi:glycosyltransferase involved in cell wall biosynthesis
MKELRYIRHDKNKGAGAARNTGIIAANGKYIAYQDSDDELLPEKLLKLECLIKNYHDL